MALNWLKYCVEDRPQLFKLSRHSFALRFRNSSKLSSRKFHKLAGILDQRLAGRQWVCGDGPTIADIALAAPMHLRGWQQLPLDEHPHLKRWMVEGIERLPCWDKTWVGEGFTTQRPAMAA